VRCPFAEWRGPIPPSNFATGPAPKIGACYHVIVGSLSSADAEFHRAGAQLSAHFGIAGPGDGFPDGHLVQWVDTDDIAYAQANGNWPPTAYTAIEVAGDVGYPMSDAQVATLGAVIAWDSALRGYPLDAVDHGGRGVTTHAHYPSGQADPAWGNHSCPGAIRIGQMPAVLAAAAKGSTDVPLPGDYVKRVKTPKGSMTLRSNGQVVTDPPGAWFDYGTLAQTGEVYNFPFTAPGVGVWQYPDLPPADRVEPTPPRHFVDLWLNP
jgi:hypothetical protein